MSEDALRRLLDIEEIKQLKARFARCVDTKDWEGWRELVTEDFHLDSEAGVHDGRDAVLAMLSTALEGASTVHHVHAPEITLTGPDEASGIWAMEDRIALVSDGSPIDFRGYGHYHEEYLRTAQGWRIRRSRLARLRIDSP